jgi:hypothetical protein
MTVNKVSPKCPNCGVERYDDERLMKREKKTRHYYCKPCIRKARLLNLFNPKVNFSFEEFKKKLDKNTDGGRDYAYLGWKHKHRQF